MIHSMEFDANADIRLKIKNHLIPNLNKPKNIKFLIPRTSVCVFCESFSVHKYNVKVHQTVTE